MFLWRLLDFLYNIFLFFKEVTPKNVHFLSTLIKTLHDVWPLTDREVSASKVQVFLMRFFSKETQNLNMVAAILNITQQPSRIFVRSSILSKWLPKSLLTTTALELDVSCFAYFEVVSPTPLKLFHLHDLRGDPKNRNDGMTERQNGRKSLQVLKEEIAKWQVIPPNP